MNRVDLAICVDLSEGSAPSRVDREAGVIRGVKLLGWASQNGRTYDPAGVDPGMYESRVVNFNHHKGVGDRSVYDRFGRVVNVVKRDDGLYGDLEYLRSHPYAESVVEAAERMPNVYGLSHTARGRERRRPGGPATIERVESVQSVDLVGDPATVAGLYESRGNGRMATMKELRESLAGSRPGYAKALKEMAEAGLMGPDATMPDPAPEASSAGADHQQAILDACKACIDDDSLAPDEKVKKIKKLLAIGAGADTPAESDSSGEDDSDDSGAANESKTVKTESKVNDELAALQAKLQAIEARDRLRSAADEAGVKLPKALLESVRSDVTEAQAKSLVAELKQIHKADAARPRSAAPVTESKETPKRESAKDIARRILAK